MMMMMMGIVMIPFRGEIPERRLRRAGGDRTKGGAISSRVGGSLAPPGSFGRCGGRRRGSVIRRTERGRRLESWTRTAARAHFFGVARPGVPRAESAFARELPESRGATDRYPWPRCFGVRGVRPVRRAKGFVPLAAGIGVDLPVSSFVSCRSHTVVFYRGERTR